MTERPFLATTEDQESQRRKWGARPAARKLRGVRTFLIQTGVGGRPELTGWWGGVWTPGMNVAECRKYLSQVPPLHGTPHDEPDEECSCGFYAYFRFPSAIADGGFSLQVRTGDVAALVETVGGKALVGEHGFRAGKVKIVALAPLWTSPRHADLAGTLADIEQHYGVPVLDDHLQLERYTTGPFGNITRG